jgi:hypothetical protein
MGAEVHHLMAQGLEFLLQLFLQFEATVIRSNAHSHGFFPFL